MIYSVCLLQQRTGRLRALFPENNAAKAKFLHEEMEMTR